MDIHVYHHFADEPETAHALARIEAIVKEIRTQGRTIIMNQATALEMLQEADRDTNEIAEQIRVLSARPDVSPELAAALTEHADRLEGVAAAGRDVQPVDPNA